MLVKYSDFIININEIKYIRYDKYGYNLVDYGGEKYPLVSVVLTDNEILELKILSNENANEYNDFENIVFENGLLKIKNIIINPNKIKYIEHRKFGYNRRLKIPTVRIVFLDNQVLDIELTSANNIKEYNEFEKTILKNQ